MSGLVAGRRRQPPPITGGSWLGELRMSARLILTSYDVCELARQRVDVPVLGVGLRRRRRRVRLSSRRRARVLALRVVVREIADRCPLASLGADALRGGLGQRPEVVVGAARRRRERALLGRPAAARRLARVLEPLNLKMRA
jgi:hypothetical protein